MSDSIVSLILAGLLSFFAVQILFSLATQIRIYRMNSAAPVGVGWNDGLAVLPMNARQNIGLNMKHEELKVANKDNLNEAYCPIPLSVIPNQMGINLCSVESVAWVKQEDDQLVSLTIKFNPEPREAGSDAPLESVEARYKDLLFRLGVLGHDGAVAEITALRKAANLDG